MWNKLNNDDYFIKFVKEEKWKEVFVSDFIEIYKVRLSEEQFFQEVKDSNPQLLEIDDSILLQIEQMLQGPASENQMIVTLLPNDVLSMKITRSVSSGFPLRLNLTLYKGSLKIFFSHVTAPLLRVVHDLNNSQNELCKLLVQKDKEINDYREDGAKLYYEHIKRLNALLRTPEFNYDNYKAQNMSVTKLFKNDYVLNCVLKKITDQETHLTLKEKENSEISSSLPSNNSLLCNKVKEECSSTSENVIHFGEPSGIESVGNTNETHSTSMPNELSIKEESKEMSRKPLKRELTNPVSNCTPPVVIKEEIQMPSSNSVIKKKQKKLLNL